MSGSMFRLLVPFCFLLVAFAGATLAQEAKPKLDSESVEGERPKTALQRFYLKHHSLPRAALNDHIRYQIEIENASSYFELADQEWNPSEKVDSSLISNYWIGVQCEPAGSVTFSPKEIPDAELTINGGMKILAVTEGGAAEESGLEEGDVLLKFAAKDMNTLNDLYAVIGETENNEASLLVVRDGELVSMRITPQERPRPESEQSVDPSAGTHYLDLRTLEDTFKQELQGKQLPEGYRLQFELVRGKEITLKVTKGDETWNVSGDSLDDLPEPVQEVASGIIEKCEPVVAMNLIPTWRIAWQAAASPGYAHRLPLIYSGDEGEQLEDIRQKLKQLAEAVRELKEKLDD